MGTRLVTIATFDQAAKARLAENALRAAGVQATVSDESLVAMDWLLSSAVGGVKVQVWEEDADRAVNVLEREFGEDGAGLGPVGIDPTELAAEAEGAGPEDEADRHDRPGEGEPDEPPAATSRSRDEDARRMVFTALLGLLFVGFALYARLILFGTLLISSYALYLFFNAAFGAGNLSPRGRFNLYVGGAMILAGLAWIMILLNWSNLQ